MPAELGSGFCWVAEQQVDLGRSVVARINRNEGLPCSGADATLVDATPLPYKRAVDATKRQLDKFANRMSFARGKHVVVGLRLLQHQPHAFDVILGVAPIPLGVDISQINRIGTSA